MYYVFNIMLSYDKTSIPFLRNFRRENMECCNRLCIYEENGSCSLDEIDLNELGLCGQCITISIDEITLKNLKKKTRDRISAAEEISGI